MIHLNLLAFIYLAGGLVTTHGTTALFFLGSFSFFNIPEKFILPASRKCTPYPDHIYLPQLACHSSTPL